jgi:hypothetical protein
MEQAELIEVDPYRYGGYHDAPPDRGAFFFTHIALEG